MKFGKPLLILAVGVFLLAVAGCGSKTTGGQKDAGAADAAGGEKVVMPAERPNLIGKVKEVVGNEVTVYKVEMNLPEQRPGENGQQKASGGPSQSSQGPEPQNGPPGLEVTEDTETFLIPVGTPIVTRERGTDETKTLAVTDIKKDQMIRVWKKDGAVVFVEVMGGARRANGNAGASGGNRPPGGPVGPPPPM